MPDDAELDGCDVDMDVPDRLTGDGEDQVALELYADVDFLDEAAVEHRRRQLVVLDAAAHPDHDHEPTTGAPDA